MKKYTTEISEEAFELLLEINKKGWMEFKNCKTNRFVLTFELEELGLIRLDEMAWHVTYDMSEKGKKAIEEILSNEKDEENKGN